MDQDREHPRTLTDALLATLLAHYPGTPPEGAFEELAADLAETAHFWSPPPRSEVPEEVRCYGCGQAHPGNAPERPRDFALQVRLIAHRSVSMRDAADLQGHLLDEIKRNGWEWAHATLRDERGSSGYLPSEHSLPE